MRMLPVLPTLLVLAGSAGTASAIEPVQEVDNRIIGEASELASWCRAEAQAHALGQGRQTYQWTASHKSEVDTLQVDGRLQLDGGFYTVTCRIARGARAHYATIDVVESAR